MSIRANLSALTEAMLAHRADSLTETRTLLQTLANVAEPAKPKALDPEWKEVIDAVGADLEPLRAALEKILAAEDDTALDKLMQEMGTSYPDLVLAVFEGQETEALLLGRVATLWAEEGKR